MTKIRITGFETVTPRIKARIARAISSSGFPLEMQKELVEEIRDAGIKPELSPSTIKKRKYLAQFNTTDAAFSPEKSNLTLSGQLLNAIRVKFQGAKLLFNINSLSGKHRRYKTGSNKGKSPLPSLRDIFDWQKELGRDVAQVFSRQGFLERLAAKLKNAILKNYRN